jgi:predicted ATPase
MKLERLQIEGYKNIRSCDIEFSQSSLINAVIGSNGSGKSNLINALSESRPATTLIRRYSLILGWN